MLTGPDPRGGFGLTMAIGDTTGDGTPDLVVSNGVDSPTPNGGEIYVFEGGSGLATGLARTVAVRIRSGPSATDPVGERIRLIGIEGSRLRILASSTQTVSGGSERSTSSTEPSSGSEGDTLLTSLDLSSIGDTGGDAYGVLLDVFVNDGALTYFVAAPFAGTNGDGVVYGFEIPTGTGEPASFAEIQIEGRTGEMLGGDTD